MLFRSIAGEPVQLEARGGIVRKVNASLLVNEVLISPHIYQDEAIAIKNIIHKAWNFIGDHQIKISDLLYPDDPVLRTALYSLTQDIDQQAAVGLPDPLGDRHQEADQEGKFQPLPQMVLEA